LIRVLTVIAGLLVFATGTTGLLQSEWSSDVGSLCEHFLGIALLGLLGFFLQRAWNRPTAKTDRGILLICFFSGAAIVLTPFEALLPQEAMPLFSGAALLFSTLATAKIYRRLEPAWTQAGEIYPLTTDSAWPTQRVWRGITCLAIFFLIACLLGTLSHSMSR
jgi:hypothetical protein